VRAVPRPPFPKVVSGVPSELREQRGLSVVSDLMSLAGWFVCPRCGARCAYKLLELQRWQCVACRHQVSLTAGTVLHNARTLLTAWFWAAYLMTTHKRGISALLLQQQLTLSRYETAWMMLHRFRRAMIDTTREPLWGDVEVDETWLEANRPDCGEAVN
jgi:transposase-like protein